MKRILLGATGLSMLITMIGFTTQAQTWTLKEPMPEKRVVSSAAVWGNDIYILGGSNSEGIVADTVLVYSTSSNTWKKAAPMPYPVVEAYAATVNDKIYVIGGFTPTGAVNTVSIYNPVTDSWTTGTSMPTSRAQISGGVIDGKIYIAGGYPWDYPSLEIYDPATDAWSSATDLPSGVLQNNGGVVYNNKFHVIGGKNYAGSSFFATNYQYNPEMDEWTEKAELPESLFAGATTVLNNKIHYLGGSITNVPVINFDVHYVYDPIEDEWSEGLTMPEERADHVAVAVGDSIYVIGGFINCTDCSSSVMAVTDLNQMYWEPKGQPDPELSAGNAAKESSSIIVFPNPCSNSFLVQSSNKVSIKSFLLFDIIGRSWGKKDVNSRNLTFDARYLPDGTYIMFIEDQAKNRYTRRVVVSHH